MMLFSLYGLLLASIAWPSHIFALEVTPGSPCAVHCLDSSTGNPFDWRDSTTKSSDIVCKDISYSTTDTGVKFRKCLECLQNSRKVSHAESDLKWFVYNAHYSVSTCLFSSPGVSLEGETNSPCVVNEACRPLTLPLTGGLQPAPENIWDYCTANDGVFMGDHLSSCISCLQSTGSETFLSNFITALEAGCRQSPQDGAILGLSGTVFTKTAIDITNPLATKYPQRHHLLPSAAIAGIVVGVVLLFFLAFALFAIHFKRQKEMDRICHEYYYGDVCGDPKHTSTSVATRGYPTHLSYHSSSGENDVGAPTGQSDDNTKPHSPTSNYALKPIFPQDLLMTAHPTHRHYNARAVSTIGSQGRIESRLTPSPPAPAYVQARSNTPDSFAIRAYVMAAEDSASLTHQPRYVNSDAFETLPSQSCITPSQPRSRHMSDVSSSLPRLRGHKKPPPPKLELHPTNSQNHPMKMYEMQISDPVMSTEARFLDRPIGGPVIIATHRVPTPVETRKYEEYTEVPLRSGKSTLYGI